MNKKILVLNLSVALFAVSCNHVYREYDKDSFPSYSWQQGQEITFSPAINDISKSYKLMLGMRHLYGMPVSSIEVTVRSISPSGKENVKSYDFKIKDSAQKYIGSCAGDFCDLETVIEDKVNFDEPGQYTYLITHNLPVEKIPGVMELGLIIDEQD